MDTICREKEGEENELERGESDVCCDQKSRCRPGGEDGLPEVLREACHFFFSKINELFSEEGCEKYETLIWYATTGEDDRPK